MSHTVAITGATGFIGSHLVRHLLDAGISVRILTRRLPVHEAYGARPIAAVIGDLADPASLRALMAGADAVVHAAGLIKARSRAAFFAANATGTRLVAEAARAQAVRAQAAPPRLVLLSSLAAREPRLSDYAASKRAGETALAEAAGGNLAWSIVRPPVVYGPGDRETLALFRAAARGLVPAPANPAARVSMIHVDDLARAIMAMLDAEPATGAVLEPDDGRAGGYGWDELAAAAGAALGTRPRLLHVPAAGLHALAAINGMHARLRGRAAMLSHGKVREICHPDWSCRGESARRLVAWQPQKDIVSGFAETAAWYRRAGWLK